VHCGGGGGHGASGGALRGRRAGATCHQAKPAGPAREVWVPMLVAANLRAQAGELDRPSHGTG